MKLSVALISYNHEKYIEKCLDSILSQVVDFNFEIVIGEDFSEDKTREIIQAYKKKYPEKINLLPSENNLGMNRNFTRTIDACKGEYVAFIEGDDYWIDVNKLQIQSDLLDENKKYSFSFCLTEVINEDSENFFVPESNKRRDLILFDFLEKNSLASCSIVFRKNLLIEWPEWIYEIGMMDWPLYIILLQSGQAGYVNKAMGVYRIHDKGINSGESKENNLKKSIYFLKKIKDFLKKEDQIVLNCSILRFYYHLSKISLEGKKMFIKYLIINLFSPLSCFKKMKTLLYKPRHNG